MGAGFAKRLIWIWLALSAITILQLGIGSIDGRGALTATVIGLALIKVRVILREFMEVRHAPVLLGRLTDLWVVLTGALLVAGYLAGTTFAKD